MTDTGTHVPAIAENLERDKTRSDFYDLAEQRYANIVESGKTIPWGEMRTCLEDRVKSSYP